MECPREMFHVCLKAMGSIRHHFKNNNNKQFPALIPDFAALVPVRDLTENQALIKFSQDQWKDVVFIWQMPSVPFVALPSNEEKKNARSSKLVHLAALHLVLMNHLGGFQAWTLTDPEALKGDCHVVWLHVRCEFSYHTYCIIWWILCRALGQNYILKLEHNVFPAKSRAMDELSA